jgi:triosephosphate isomerase
VARRIRVGTSWKMNKTRAEAAAWCDALLAAPRIDGADLFVMPPFTALALVAERLRPAGVAVGAQDVHWEDAGAWTGAISALQAKDCGATMAEIGHSERRRWFGETDETVAAKTAAALRHGLTPLVCVGETAAERDAGAADAVLERQARAALAAGPAGVALAYEPVWAIGVGAASAEPAHVRARIAALRETAARLGAAAPVLYGGSVDEATCAAFIAEAGADGVFVGRAALDPRRFHAIARLCAAAAAG